MYIALNMHTLRMKRYYTMCSSGSLMWTLREREKKATTKMKQKNTHKHTQVKRCAQENMKWFAENTSTATEQVGNCLKAYIYFSAFQHDVNIMNFSIFMHSIRLVFRIHHAYCICTAFCSTYSCAVEMLAWKYRYVGSHFRQNRYTLSELRFSSVCSFLFLFLVTCSLRNTLLSTKWILHQRNRSNIVPFNFLKCHVRRFSLFE